ncbi:MAG: SPFH domain-containing protein [Planctomycetota bacterium]
MSEIRESQTSVETVECGQTGSDRRAKNVAIVGCILQLAAFGTVLGVGIWSESHAVLAVARFMLVGIPTWFILFLVFKQARRVSVESLETTELKRAREAGAGSALFELDDEALLLERNRLRWMVRWMLPATTVLLALYLLLGQFSFWGWTLGTAFDKGGLRLTQSPTLVMWFVIATGFLCFLYARYSIALSRMPGWGLLRAGATSMAGNALACVGLAVALMVSTSADWAQPLLAYVVRVAMVVLGLEFAGNFVLDFYRPRTSDQLPRPSFDSRLLGLIGEPGGIAKSIADAINYQFGFEVSSTWFYQLLQRWLGPILLVTVLIVLAMTSVVIVDASEEAVVERFGRPVAVGSGRLKAGLHLKWPFPIDIVRRAPIHRIGELVIGEATEDDKEHADRAIIWTEAHEYLPELMLLVASPKLAALSADDRPSLHSAGVGKSVAVSLLMVSVPIEYRIKDLDQFLYQHGDPLKLLEAVAYQYLSNYAAGVDIDQLMGPGREVLNRELAPLIQKRLDELGVGIEILFAGIRAAHPPSSEKVAEAFQGVVSAEILKSATIEAAEGVAQRKLTAAAGTEARAKNLDEAIQARDELERNPKADAQARSEAEERVNDLLLGNPAKGIPPMSGAAAAIIAGARADASDWISREAAKARAFQTEVTAYTAAPKLYMARKVLDLYRDLDSVRKYVIVGDPAKVLIEYDTVEQSGLDRVLSEGLDAERKKRNQ